MPNPAHLECPVCHHIFLPERPSRVGGCCSPRCARLLDAEKRNPGIITKADKLMAAIEADIERILKS
jgi:hypothetical protein